MKDIWRSIRDRLKKGLNRGEMSNESEIKGNEKEDRSPPFSGDNPLSDPRTDLLDSAPFFETYC